MDLPSAGRATVAHGIAIEPMAGEPLLREKRPEPCTIVIFGLGGDLSKRKLIPALYNLALDHALPEPIAILGVGRRPATAESLREQLRDAASQFSRQQPLDDSTWQRLMGGLDYVDGRFEDPRTYASLREKQEAAERERATQGNRLFYLATPPAAFGTIVEQLRAAGLLYEHRPPESRPWCRVVIEKPFGVDLRSARELNAQLARYLDESQTFRVDHYLGKETVQNILVFRFGNAIFEPLWNRKLVDHVRITAHESVGVEGRGRLYDSTGVVRDVVQSHLLQMLALTTMEPPFSFGADDIRNEKVRILRSLRPVTGEEVWRSTVRAQYRGYHQEPGVSPQSRTPTYAAIKLFIDSWRWQGVPFYLRAGKRLRQRLTEVTIAFQSIPSCLFPQDGDACQSLQPNLLTMRIQPDEGISLRFVAKVPGGALSVANVSMTMCYANAFRGPIAEAYERLLLEVMRGDNAHFTRRDAIEHEWAFVGPILEAWEADRDRPIPVYEPGSDGPTEAEALE